MKRGTSLLSRRQFLKITSAAGLGAMLTGCQSLLPRKRPNILFIAVDDLRPELGCYGDPHIKTPNIDRIAGNGITFTQAHCQSAVCNPSRASLMTGLRPDTIKVWSLRDKFRDTVPDVVTLPQYFKKNGYHTAAIGKIYHNDIPDPPSWSEPKIHLNGFPFDPDAGYINKENLDIQAKNKESFMKRGEAGYTYVWYDRFGYFYTKANATEIGIGPDNAYYDGLQTDAAVKKLSQLNKRGQPFFFAIGYYRPHLPFNAPKKYWDMYDPEEIPLAENDFMPRSAPDMAINNLRELRGYKDFKGIKHPKDGTLSEEEARHLKHGYYASVSYVDAQVGRLLDQLDELGIRDNTIIVLWGDHGWKLGEHNSWCKMTNYEIDTRVPLIISTPGTKHSPKKSDRLVEFVDVYPTLCDLAGLPIPEKLEGLSTAPLISEPDQPWKKAVFSQFLREGIWVAPDGREYMGYAIRTERYRYVEWIDWETKALKARELYDHDSDPMENINIADRTENSELVQQLAAQMKNGWKAALPE